MYGAALSLAEFPGRNTVECTYSILIGTRNFGYLLGTFLREDKIDRGKKGGGFKAELSVLKDQSDWTNRP